METPLCCICPLPSAAVLHLHLQVTLLEARDSVRSPLLHNKMVNLLLVREGGEELVFFLLVDLCCPPPLAAAAPLTVRVWLYSLSRAPQAMLAPQLQGVQVRMHAPAAFAPLGPICTASPRSSRPGPACCTAASATSYSGPCT